MLDAGYVHSRRLEHAARTWLGHCDDDMPRSIEERLMDTGQNSRSVTGKIDLPHVHFHLLLPIHMLSASQNLGPLSFLPTSDPSPISASCSAATSGRQWARLVLLTRHHPAPRSQRPPPPTTLTVILPSVPPSQVELKSGSTSRARYPIPSLYLSSQSPVARARSRQVH